MKKRTIIVGAGFSITANIPPQKSIIPLIIKTSESELFLVTASIVTDFKLVKEIFLPLVYGPNYLSKIDQILLEDIYTIIDNAILEQRNIGFLNHSALIRIRSAFDNCIYYIINKEFSDEVLNQYSSKIKTFLRKPNSVCFISTNWDTLLESTISFSGYGIDFGIENKKDDGKILVLKPHGSYQWKWCPICDRIYLNANNIISCNNCNTVFASKLIHHYKNLAIQQVPENKLLPIITTPTFLKNNTLHVIKKIFQQMYQQLISSDEIIFIGYSLPISDHDIREVIIKANTINKNQKIKVVLKERTKTAKQTLINNYKSIFEEDKLTFKWNGF